MSRNWVRLAQQIFMASFVGAIVGYAFHEANGDFTGLLRGVLFGLSPAPGYARVVTLSLVLCIATVRVSRFLACDQIVYHK
jgi:hypothetical protein